MLEAEASFARAARPITEALKAVSSHISGELLPLKEGLMNMSQLALLPPEPVYIPISAQTYYRRRVSTKTADSGQRQERI